MLVLSELIIAVTDRDGIAAPLLRNILFPGLMIFLTIISVNYIGDGLRDAFDPYKVLETVGEYT